MYSSKASFADDFADWLKPIQFSQTGTMVLGKAHPRFSPSVSSILNVAL